MKETRDWTAAERREAFLGRASKTCIRCLYREALPYPNGRGGQLCKYCEDLQTREIATPGFRYYR